MDEDIPDWVKQLAGILPLSAVIDFLDVPRVLHVFNLRGAVPAWCWPITPAGSRLLLKSFSPIEPCFLDRYESGPKPLCWDGRYGDEYPMANAATVSLANQAVVPHVVINAHPNLEAERGKRPQTLEVVCVLPASAQDADLERGKDRVHHHSDSWHTFLLALTGILISSRKNKITFFHNATVIIGWAAWICLVAICAARAWWVAFAFLILIITSGLLFALVHGNTPRHLGQRDPSEHQRAVISASNVNATDWVVYHGRSDVVNSLVNWPLQPSPRVTPHWIFWQMLRLAIYGQWALAVGAAAQQHWDAYVITAWIFVCIFAIDFVFCSKHAVYEWMNRCAGLRLERITVQVSSRRALLNAIIAINGDTFHPDPKGHDSIPVYREAGIRWLDEILEPCEERKDWLEATRIFLHKDQYPPGHFDTVRAKYEGDPKKYWWWRFIQEGTTIAQGLKQTMPK